MGSKQPSSGGNANSIMVQIQDKARVRTYDELSHILQEGQELEVNMSVAARLDAAKRRLQEKYDKVYSAGSPKRQRVMIGPGRASSKPVIISVPTSADTEIYYVAYEPEYVCL